MIDKGPLWHPEGDFVYCNKTYFSQCPHEAFIASPGEELVLHCARQSNETLTTCRWKDPYNRNVYPNPESKDGYGRVFCGSGQHCCSLVFKRGVQEADTGVWKCETR